MIKYELKKICNHKVIALLFVVLLLFSGVLFYIYQQHQPAYRYIYQGRAQYERFLQGNIEADLYGFYAEDIQKQIRHKESYGVFIEGMEERAEQTMLLLANSDEQSYVYANAIKTCEDYKSLADTQIVIDNCYGVIELAKFDTGIFFLIGFIVAMAYFVFYEERKTGMLLLIKGTRNGHSPLVFAKLLVMVAGVVLFAILQEVVHFSITGYLYGYGDLNRSMQSVPEFRNCPFEISVGEGILIMVLVRIWIAFFLSVFISMTSILVRNELAAVLFVGVFLILEFTACHMFSLTGSANYIKCVNPFFFWNMTNMLATYLNLNIFGNAVGKEIIAGVVSVVGIVGSLVVGDYFFRHKYQIRMQSRLDKVLIWWRHKTSFLWKNVNLLWFEVYKTLIQQKRVFLVVLIFVISLVKINDINALKYYDNAYEVSYDNYLKKISGKVTDETIAFINSEKAYIDNIQKQWEELEDPEGKDYGVALQLDSELQLKAEAVRMMVMQLELLQEMPGSIYDKYLVNEGAYLDLFCDAESQGVWWFISTAFVIIWLSGVYPADRSKEVYALVNTTKNGRRQLEIRKNRTIAIGVGLFWGMAQLVEIVEYYCLDGFKGFLKPLSEFTTITLESNMTIGTFFVLSMILKVISIILVAMIATWLSRKTNNEMVINIVGVVFVGAVAFVCVRFNTSIGGWLLSLMYV